MAETEPLAPIAAARISEYGRGRAATTAMCLGHHPRGSELPINHLLSRCDEDAHARSDARRLRRRLLVIVRPCRSCSGAGAAREDHAVRHCSPPAGGATPPPAPG